MVRHRISSLNGQGIADFDELIHKKIHRIVRPCLIALHFDPTMLIEIAACILVIFKTCRKLEKTKYHLEIHCYAVSFCFLQVA